MRPEGVTRPERYKKVMALEPPLRMRVRQKRVVAKALGESVTYYRCVCSACPAGCCTKHAGVWWTTSGEHVHFMRVMAAGQFPEKSKARGCMVWSTQEMAVIARVCEGRTHITTGQIKAAFKAASSKMRAEREQLWSWVARSNNQKKERPRADAQGTPVEALRLHVERWQQEHNDWESSALGSP